MKKIIALLLFCVVLFSCGRFGNHEIDGKKEQRIVCLSKHLRHKNLNYSKYESRITEEKNGQLVTRNIAKKGFIGMRSSSLASISLHLDSDVLRNPFQAILPTLAVILKQHSDDKKDIDIIKFYCIKIPIAIFFN